MAGKSGAYTVDSQREGSQPLVCPGDTLSSSGDDVNGMNRDHRLL